MLLIPNSYGARLREFNPCHSKEDGKFCSTAGLSPAGDELSDSPSAPVGTPFRVLRIAARDDTTLRDRNAGNADAVDDLYMRALDDDGPVIGNTLHVYEVTLAEAPQGYQRFNRGLASELPGVPTAPGKVGRHKRDAELLYSFPADGKWKAALLASIPTERAFRQYGAPAERVSALRKAVTEAIGARTREAWLREFNPCHSKSDGRFCSEPGGQGQWAATRSRAKASRASRGDMRAATDAERKKLGIPPAYTNVQIATNPKADLRATAVTAKGKTVSFYSKQYTDQQAAAKWARVVAFNREVPRIAAKVDKDANNPKSEHQSEAMALRLILQTGLRNGGDDGGGDEEAFGASNLRTDHVSVDGATVRMQFPGKHGVAQDHSVTDPLFAKWVLGRMDAGKETVFDHDSDATLRYLQSLTPKTKFKVHDLRTWVATVYADTLVQAAVKGGVLPKTKKDYKAFLKEISTKVAGVLGNNAGQALKSYIHPAVFKPFEVT